MPNNTRAMHPSGLLGITFTEDDHSYVDDFGIDYTSGTTLVKSAFEEFDAKKAAAIKSAKTGIPADQYIAEWKAAGERAAMEGTRAHENCERQILGRIADMNQPQDDDERARFRAAWFEVEKLKAAFPPDFMHRSSLEPEKLVFSPRFRVSGSVDLLAHRSDGKYFIFDWKYVKEIKREGFNGKTGIHIASRHLPDCNFYHYALQLSIYEQVMKCEGYIPPDATVERWLNVYRKPTADFEHVQLPDLGREALLLMAWNATCDNLEYVPF